MICTGGCDFHYDSERIHGIPTLLAATDGVALDDIFFLQEEDGIRSLYVTGVQTCALPILLACDAELDRASRTSSASPASTRRSSNPTRSEERRVGKDCRGVLRSVGY